MTHAEYQRQYYRRNREKVARTIRERLERIAALVGEGIPGSCSKCGVELLLTPARIANRHYRCWRCKKWDGAQEYGARWRAKNPLKKIAHHTLNNAIRAGLVSRQPCERCGSDPGHAHHEDYSQPLIVRWLCRRCHAAEHTKLARIA